MARLTKRASPKSVEPPKPLPARGAVEPETYLCEDAKTVMTNAERMPMLGMCINCHVNPAHSEVDHMCYSCRRTRDGYVFDPEKKRYVKEEK